MSLEVITCLHRPYVRSDDCNPVGFQLSDRIQRRLHAEPNLRNSLRSQIDRPAAELVAYFSSGWAWRRPRHHQAGTLL
jgi:hypothetical protein